MDTFIVVNPRAGGVGDVAAVVEACRSHPELRDPEVVLTEAPGHASALVADAVRRGARRILACGGDGTLHEVVNGIGPGRLDVTVGVIPLGTGNDFARSIGVPPGTREALELLPDTVTREVDLVRVRSGTELYGINVSAGGFSGQVDEELTAEMKVTWGPLAYLRSALSILPDLHGYSTYLALDDEEERCVDALNVVVANGRTAAGGIPVAPRARLDDGLLDVVVVEMAALRDLARVGPRILVGKHLDHELVRFWRARTVRLRSEPGMWFNVDGELIGKRPVEFTVVPRAIRVLAHPTGAPGLAGG